MQELGEKHFFGNGRRSLNSKPCIFYTLSQPTELSSREKPFFRRKTLSQHHQ